MTGGWPARFGAGLPAAAAVPGQLFLCLWEWGGSDCAEVSAFVLLWGVYLCGSCLLSWVRLHLRCYQQKQEQPSPEPGCVGTSRPPCRGRQSSHTNGHWLGTNPRAKDGTCMAFQSPFPLHHFGSTFPLHPGSRGRRHGHGSMPGAAVAAVEVRGGGSGAVRALPGLTSHWVLHPTHRGDRSPVAPIPPSPLGCPIPVHPPLPSSSGWTPPAVSTNPNH